MSLPRLANLDTGTALVINDGLQALQQGRVGERLGGIEADLDRALAGAGSDVSSVNSKTGAVVLAASDVGAAPIPIATSGPGQIVALNPVAGAAAVLPSGGQWSFFLTPYVTATGAIDSATPVVAGVGAGGATVADAITLDTWIGFAFRIS